MSGNQSCALIVGILSLGWMGASQRHGDFVAGLVGAALGILGLYAAFRIWQARATSWWTYVI